MNYWWSLKRHYSACNRCAKVMLFASRVNFPAQHADNAYSADSSAGFTDRETYLEVLGQRMLQLYSHTYCLRGLKERTLLLLDALLTSLQLPSSGALLHLYRIVWRAETMIRCRIWGVSLKLLHS